MRKTLYVANLDSAATEEQLRELFGQHGDVVSIEFGSDERTELPYALVEMESEKIANKANHSLNGHRLADRHLSISYPGVDQKKELTSRQRKDAEAIAAELGETDKVPTRQIAAIVQLCGASFAQALVKEAQEIEAGDGQMTADGERRRTLGGVFFYLARYRLAPPVRRIIYTRKGKMPRPPEEVEAEKEAEQAEPAVE